MIEIIISSSISYKSCFINNEIYMWKKNVNTFDLPQLKKLVVTFMQKYRLVKGNNKNKIVLTINILYYFVEFFST